MITQAQVQDAIKEWEKKAKAQRERNDMYLSVFKEDLAQSDLSARVIKRHYTNATIFLNEYCINYSKDDTLEASTSTISGFLSWYIPEKYIGNTKEHIKENSASLRKLFKSMSLHGYISDEKYEEFSAEISEAVADGGHEYDQFTKEFKEDHHII